MDASFTLSLQSLIFVCFMVGIAGFVDAAAGGGGIISLPAYMFTGMPAHYALGTNKFSGSCGTTLAVFKFWKSGALDIKASLIAAAGSFLGSAAGAKAALMMSDQTLKTILIFILPAAALIISLKRDLDFLRKTTNMEDIKEIQKGKKEEIQQKQTSFEFYS